MSQLLFYEDLRALCYTQASSKEHAKQILECMADLISDELLPLSQESRDFCGKQFLHSQAFASRLPESRGFIIDWLISADKLQKQRLLFIGIVMINDQDVFASSIRASQAALDAVVEIIWTYRFTEPELVEIFLLILFRVFVLSGLEEQCLQKSFPDEFLKYLYQCVQEDNTSHAPLMVIAALNDQFMLHDKRGDDNRVFAILAAAPTRYSAICHSLVLLFNRCGNEDQDLKIFISKFFYLVFTAPTTHDLLYTNDLIVLAEIVIRELNDIPLETLEVRAMYLRLLYAMLKHSPLEQNGSSLKDELLRVLQSTLLATQDLPEKDSIEINRLTTRCLEISWLATATTDESSGCRESAVPTSQNSATDHNLPSQAYSSNAGASHSSGESLPEETSRLFTSKTGSQRSPCRPPVPPPPPPPPRQHSVASINSSDSRQSLDAVYHFVPPPPLPRKRR